MAHRDGTAQVVCERAREGKEGERRGDIAWMYDHRIDTGSRIPGLIVRHESENFRERRVQQGARNTEKQSMHLYILSAALFAYQPRFMEAENEGKCEKVR